MICKLCGQDKKLIKAHIIPDFMYHGMFGENHDLISVNLSNHNNKKKIQTGCFDKHILCQTCDNEIIGSYERYASKHIFDQKIQASLSTLSENIKSYTKEVNYKEFKLFLLSILWRASVSTLPFFKNLKIADKEERLRQMLLNGVPDQEHVFPISMIKIAPTKSHQSRLIIDPVVSDIGEDRVCIFYINGFFYYFSVSETSTALIFESTALREDNTMVIPVLENEQAIGFLDRFVKRQVWKQ